jgi:hypothetical protein
LRRVEAGRARSKGPKAAPLSKPLRISTVFPPPAFADSGNSLRPYMPVKSRNWPRQALRSALQMACPSRNDRWSASSSAPFVMRHLSRLVATRIGARARAGNAPIGDDGKHAGRRRMGRRTGLMKPPAPGRPRLTARGCVGRRLAGRLSRLGQRSAPGSPISRR